MATEQTQSENTPKREVTEAVQRLRQTLNERLIEQAAKGEAPWQQKLDPTKGDRLPYNPFSKTGEAIYGINGVILSSIAQEKGFTDPRWITKEQMEYRGWGPVKGQSPASVEYYSDHYSRQIRDERGNPVFDKDGKAIKEEVKRDVPMTYAVNMYNLSQIRELQYAKEKIPQLATVPRSPDIDSLSKLVRDSGVKVEADGNSYYSKTQDGVGIVHIPKTGELVQGQALLRGIAEKAVLLDGPAGARRDDTPQTSYVKQQIRVDLATQMMSEKLGIPMDSSKMTEFGVHQAEILRKNPDEIKWAAIDANRAVERMTKGNFQPRRQQEQQQQQEQQVQVQVQVEHKEPEKQQREIKAPAKVQKNKGLER